jgi:hypothetical protein
MGTAAPAPPVKPIVALLAASPALLDAARATLAAELAAIELTSEPRRWTASTYYESEMGSEVWRQYVGLAGLMRPEDLAVLKRRSNALEARWCDDAGRKVNLDPGYVDLNRLVLASTKDAAHRVYLGQGIYAESTLRYVGGGFQTWPYTYADYGEPDALAFFNQVRARYRAERQTAPRCLALDVD